MHSVLEELYASAHWTMPEGWDSTDRILEKVRALRKQSSPGYPLCLAATTNERLLDIFGEDAVVGWVQTRMDELAQPDSSPTPSRIFVKREPHKAKKRDTGAWRLIWSMDVVDQVIDHLLWDPSLDVEIEQHSALPSKPGFSWVYGGAEVLYRTTLQRFGGGDCVELDKSSWDWTFQAWMHEADLEWRLRRHRGPADDAWVSMFRTRVRHHAQAPAVFSDGTLLEQIQPGLMRSGLVNTLSTNSVAQVMLKLLFVYRQGQRQFDQSLYGIISQGDDTLEKVPAEERAAYREFLLGQGHLPQEEHSGKLIDLSFCSHAFQRVDNGRARSIVAVPTNWAKHSFALKFKEKKQFEVFGDQLFSLCIEYAWDPTRFPQLWQVLCRYYPAKARSLRYFRGIHDKPP